jgi:AraC-like DNA-binding protein
MTRRKTSDWLPVNAEFIAGRVAGPKSPPEWAPMLRRLMHVARSPQPPPEWWTHHDAYYGSVETRTSPEEYMWDGLKRPRPGPFFCFQFTLAGVGAFESESTVQPLVPGSAFFAIVPSRHRYYLPERSPGWTFGWFAVHHPYLLERIGNRVRSSGEVLTFKPDSALAALAARLVSGAFRRDFRDRLEVEQALFEFMFVYERFAEQSAYPGDERARLLEQTRVKVIRDPKRVLQVDALAAEHGMSRSHFSHFFKARTGLTPARFATQVRIQEAARLLLHTQAPIKQIADELGFADVNHFCKVFRRFQNMSPAMFRRTPL